MVASVDCGGDLFAEGWVVIDPFSAGRPKSMLLPAVVTPPKRVTRTIDVVIDPSDMKKIAENVIADVMRTYVEPFDDELVKPDLVPDARQDRRPKRPGR